MKHMTVIYFQMSYFIGTKPVDNVHEEEVSHDTRELSARVGNAPQVSQLEKIVDDIMKSTADSHTLKSQKGQDCQKPLSYEDHAKSLFRQGNSVHSGWEKFKCELCL